MCDFHDFVAVNSGFLLTLFAGVNASFGALCLCIIRSRCRTIKCGPCFCERAVLSEAALAAEVGPQAAEATQSTPTPPV